MWLMGAPSMGESPQERILSAARRIVAERGMTALSVQTVATEADVTKSAISYHFGSKDGLVRAIIESMAVKEPDEARQAVGRIEDPAERFHAFMALYLDRVRNNVNFRIAFALGPTSFNEEKIRVFAKTAALDMEALHLPRDPSGRGADGGPHERHHRPRVQLHIQRVGHGPGRLLRATGAGDGSCLPLLILLTQGCPCRHSVYRLLSGLERTFVRRDGEKQEGLHEVGTSTGDPGGRVGRGACGAGDCGRRMWVHDRIGVERGVELAVCCRGDGAGPRDPDTV